MPIRAVLWDIDDTIFDYAGADRTGMRLHLEGVGLPEAYASVDEALDDWKAITDRHWARVAAGETDFLGQRRTGCGTSSRGRWRTRRPTPGSPVI